MSWREISYVLSTSENYVWSELDYYTSPDNVSRTLKRRFASLKANIAETKAIEISSCVKQAQEYYNSSRQVDYVSKPLLLFYGMESLTIALCMILQENLTIRNLKRSHGVEFVKYELKENEIDLSKILIKISERGTFPELFKLGLSNWALPRHIDASQHVRQDVSKQSASYKDDEDRIKFINCYVRLKDLLSLIPEIYADYIRIYDEHPNIFSGLHKYFWEGENLKKVEVFIDKRTKDVTRELILKKLSMLGEGYEIDEKEKYIKFTCTPDKTSPIFCEDVYDETFVASQIPAFKGKPDQLFEKRLGFVDMEAHFLIMFALSILSRYELNLWNSLMINKEKGIDYLIKKFLLSSHKKYPLLVLREITSLNIRQRTPGTLVKQYE